MMLPEFVPFESEKVIFFWATILVLPVTLLLLNTSAKVSLPKSTMDAIVAFLTLFIALPPAWAPNIKKSPVAGAS